jgi:hypothetical protein
VVAVAIALAVQGKPVQRTATQGNAGGRQLLEQIAMTVAVAVAVAGEAGNAGLTSKGGDGGDGIISHYWVIVSVPVVVAVVNG